MPTYHTQLADITAAFKNSFGSLTAEQLNHKPNAETWSIAENIAHLIVINETYYPIVAQIRRNEYKLSFFARFGFLVNWLGGFILQSVERTAQRKIKTFEIWQPQQSTLNGDILAQFEAHQTELAAFMASCDDLLAKKQVIASPANANIVYTLAAAFAIIIEHEWRHLAQAKTVLKTL